VNRIGVVGTGRIGFGTAQLVGDGCFGPSRDRAGAVDVLRRAVDLGVRFVDTAANYGPFVAEELVAEALHPYADGVFVASKCGVERVGPNATRHAGRPEALRAEVEGSVRRLRVERIDLMQLHRIDPDVPLADQLGALVEMREAGLIAEIGLDTVTVDRLDAALALAPIVSVQNRYNVRERADDDVLAACERAGVVFLPWYPLGNGAALADPAVVEVAARHGVSAARVAIAWLLHRSPAILPTPGTRSPDHLADNLAASSLRLDPVDLADLDRAHVDRVGDAAR